MGGKNVLKGSFYMNSWIFMPPAWKVRRGI